MRSNTVKKNSGITLIALVITIIVMLILVAVTISMAVNGGLFEYAGKAVGDTNNAMLAEQQLANGGIKVDGIWYDSIDDYLAKKPSTNQGENEEEGPVSIELSIAGTKVTTVPVPTGFTHTEGTIDTGYVIQDEDGNEFVWVPVDKNQKITLKVESEKDIQNIVLKDPMGEEIDLGLAEGNIGKSYNNTQIEPTYNGMYVVRVETEDGIVKEALTVRSLYAIDTLNDWYISDEGVEWFSLNMTGSVMGKEDAYGAVATQMMQYESLEVAMETNNCADIDEFITFVWTTMQWSQIEELTDYKAYVNDNGGFYIARYEAGAPTARISGSKTATVEEIKTANGIPVSKEGYAPYNNVTHTQAKGLAESMYEENNSYEVSLITGSGWDRTLGWIQETGSKSVQEIAGDSTSWGNYANAEFEISKGKYLDNNGQTYQEVSGTYKKPEEESILLTTGATTRNFANNIFDLAGNVEEWTNEAVSSGNLVGRGRCLQLLRLRHSSV